MVRENKNLTKPELLDFSKYSQIPKLQYPQDFKNSNKVTWRLYVFRQIADGSQGKICSQG